MKLKYGLWLTPLLLTACVSLPDIPAGTLKTPSVMPSPVASVDGPQQSGSVPPRPSTTTLLKGQILIQSGILLPSGILIQSGILPQSGILQQSGFTAKQATNAAAPAQGFLVEAIDTKGKVYGPSVSDKNGQYQIPTIPVGTRIQIKATAPANKNFTLQALADIPTTKAGIETVKNITTGTTAVALIVQDGQKRGSALADIPLLQFETTPELVALAQKIEKQIVDSLSKKLDAALQEIQTIKIELQRVNAELQQLKQQKPEIGQPTSLPTPVPTPIPAASAIPNGAQNPMPAASTAPTAPAPSVTPSPTPLPTPTPGVAILLSPQTSSLTVGATLQLTATVTGSATTSVTWQSSNTNTATVSSTGLVTAAAAGTVAITAQSVSNPSSVASLNLTVNQPSGSGSGTGKIVYALLGDIYTINPDGSNQVRLTNNTDNDTAPAWSPNGTQVLFVSDRDGNDEIYVMNADGSGQTRLTQNTAFDLNPVWSPDGTKIAFMSNVDGNNEIYVINATGSGLLRLTNHSGVDNYPTWAPNGNKIAYTNSSGGGQLMVINPDGSSPTALASSVVQTLNSWAPDSSKLVFLKVVADLYSIGTATGSTALRLTTTNNNAKPVWSPDGTKIAFESTSGGDKEIMVMNADGSNAMALTNNNNTDEKPAWSPDSTQLVFISNRDGNYEIYKMNTDGSNQTRLTNTALSEDTPKWR